MVKDAYGTITSILCKLLNYDVVELKHAVSNPISCMYKVIKTVTM